MCATADLTRGESVNCDNWDGDIGASSKQNKTKKRAVSTRMQSLSWLAGRLGASPCSLRERRARTWSEHVRESLHALDPAPNPPDVDEGEYNRQRDDPAHGAERYRQDGHGGRHRHLPHGNRTRRGSWQTLAVSRIAGSGGGGDDGDGGATRSGHQKTRRVSPRRSGRPSVSSGSEHSGTDIVCVNIDIYIDVHHHARLQIPDGGTGIRDRKRKRERAGRKRRPDHRLRWWGGW